MGVNEASAVFEQHIMVIVRGGSGSSACGKLKKWPYTRVHRMRVMKVMKATH